VAVRAAAEEVEVAPGAGVWRWNRLVLAVLQNCIGVADFAGNCGLEKLYPIYFECLTRAA